MERSYIHVLLFFFVTNGVMCQRKVFIDVQSDIPNDDASWDFDCDGYGDLSTEIDCGDFGGKINIPPEDLNGERGFWASCGYCVISYNMKPEDTSLKARLYQRSIQTEVSFDGENWEFIQGEGWVVLDREFQGETHVISFRFEHFTSDMFNLLEKIAINGDFEPPTDPEPTTTTTTTENESSAGSTEGDVTSATTELTETTTDDDNIISSTISDSSSSTTDYDYGSTSSETATTDSSSSTTDDNFGSTSSATSEASETTSFSTTTDDPTEPSSEDPSSTTEDTSSTTEDTSSTTEDTSSTTEDTSSTTDFGSTTDFTETTTEDDKHSSTSDVPGTTGDDVISTSETSDLTTLFSTTEDGNSGSSNPGTSTMNPPTTELTTNPSTPTTGPPTTTTAHTTGPPTTDITTTPAHSGPTTSVAPPATAPTYYTIIFPTTTKIPVGSGFFNGVWDVLVFSLLGVFLFFLVCFICCIRCGICHRGGILRRRRGMKDDTEDILSERDSTTSHERKIRDGRELYTYVDRYPHLIHIPTETKSKPKSTTPKPSSSSYDPYSPSAIYREGTPYLIFGQPNVGPNNASNSKIVQVQQNPRNLQYTGLNFQQIQNSQPGPRGAWVVP